MSDLLSSKKTLDLKKELNIALIGFPNSGKTTLYNWLTGSKFKTVNYPGSTVEFSTGRLINHYDINSQHQINLIDTPGIYSFDPQSADEELTLNVLKKASITVPIVNLVLVVIDATQISRQLGLVRKLILAKIPFKVVLTMSDLIQKNQQTIQIQKLELLLGADVVTFDGVLGKGLTELIETLDKKSDPNLKTQDGQFDNWLTDNVTKSRAWTADILNTIDYEKSEGLLSSTLKIDKYLLHPFFGYVFFFLVMTALFSSIYWFAAPFMDIIDQLFSTLSEFVKSHITGLSGEFLSEGVIAAIGGIVIFGPQIFILFSLIYILEASGYLARVAILVDRPLTKIGLGGRSFVPMLSGFACAIPAIIATRNISSKKEKLIAQSLIPLLTCSARIPVYSLMISFLFKDTNDGSNYILAGFIMAALYLGSIVISAIVSGILSKLIDSNETPRLMMDLPLYRRPLLKIVLLYGLSRTKSFIQKAGPIIFVLSIVIWFATNFPRNSELSSSQIAQQSYAAQVGKVIEPVFTPMGLDWRVGFGIISAFAAREVFVSSLALIFNAEPDENISDTGPENNLLLSKMRDAKFPDGRAIFTLGSSLGIIVFFMIAMQCLATFAILRRETGSYTIATTQLVLSNLAAYGLAVGINYLFLFM